MAANFYGLLLLKLLFDVLVCFYSYGCAQCYGNSERTFATVFSELPPTNPVKIAGDPKPKSN